MNHVIVSHWPSLCGALPATTLTVHASKCSTCRVLGDSLSEFGFVNAMGHIDRRVWPFALEMYRPTPRPSVAELRIERGLMRSRRRT